jgi:ComF family protein
MCVCCGRPFPAAAAEFSLQPVCRLCRVSFYAFDRARSFAVYDEALSKAVILLKYEEVLPLGEWFASRLAEIVPRTAGATDEWRADVVAPVPLHADRRRERGYNQAELIARPLAARLHIKLEPRLLIRTRPRPSRLVLSRTEHWKSVRGAYAIAGEPKIDNLRILLIDDVLTTGATLDACSRTLKKAGAAAVMCLTVGRVKSALNATGSPQIGRLRTPGKPEGKSRAFKV